MSQAKFLQEDEVRSFINELLVLKLEPKNLQNPDSETVCDIYTRFLDLTVKDRWREAPGSDGFEPSLKISMHNWLRFLFEPYNVNYEFNFHDLVKPKRQRTIAFLNIIIHIRITIEECKDELLKREAEYMENEAAWERINDDIEQKRQLQDQLELEKSSKKESSADLQEQKKRLRAEFEYKKKESDDFQQKGFVAKKEFEEANAIYEKNLARVEALRTELREGEDLLKKLDNGLLLKSQTVEKGEKVKDLQINYNSFQDDIEKLRNRTKEITECLSALDRVSIDDEAYKNLFDTHKRDKQAQEEKIRKIKTDQIEEKATLSKSQAELRQSESASDKLELQYRIELEKIRKKLYEKRTKKIEREIEFEKELDQINQQIKDARDQQIKYRTDLKNKQEKNAALLEKAQRMFDVQVKRFRESQSAERKSIIRLSSHAHQLETIIGKPKEGDMPANRTYIKEESQ